MFVLEREREADEAVLFSLGTEEHRCGFIK